MFLGVERPFDIIFCILGTDKATDEVAYVLFCFVECALELIIFLLDVLRNDFGECDEALLEGVEITCEHIL
jgi:hypothetical protein